MLTCHLQHKVSFLDVQIIQEDGKNLNLSDVSQLSMEFIHFNSLLPSALHSRMDA